PCIIEHAVHKFHIGRSSAPAADGLVEIRGKTKHQVHRFHVGDVPVADIAIEIGSPLEQAAHIHHAAHVPLTDGGGIAGKADGAGKHPRHIRYGGEVGLIGSGDVEV